MAYIVYRGYAYEIIAQQVEPEVSNPPPPDEITSAFASIKYGKADANGQPIQPTDVIFVKGYSDVPAAMQAASERIRAKIDELVAGTTP